MSYCGQRANASEGSLPRPLWWLVAFRAAAKATTALTNNGRAPNSGSKYVWSVCLYVCVCRGDRWLRRHPIVPAAAQRKYAAKRVATRTRRLHRTALAKRRCWPPRAADPRRWRNSPTVLRSLVRRVGRRAGRRVEERALGNNGRHRYVSHSTKSAFTVY